jgi:hypothetical protein
MKKIAILVIALFLCGIAPLSAADKPQAAPAASSSEKAEKKGVFNSVAAYLSTFDRPFTRKDNKKGFWNSTAEWMRTIDKY